MRTMKHLAVVVASVALMGCPVKPVADGGTGGGSGGGTTGGGGGAGGGGGSGGGGIRTGGGTGGGGMTTDGGTGGGGTATGGGTGGGGMATGGGTGGGGAMGGGMGTSCANPIPLVLPPAGTGVNASGKIDVAGKKIYYGFTADAGEYLSISTDSNPNDDRGVLDTAVTIFDGAGTRKLASIDDAYPRVSTDTQMFYRTPTAGAYCMMVEEWSTWAGETPAAFPEEYTITIVRLLSTLPTTNLDTEPNDTPSAAQLGKAEGPRLPDGGLDDRAQGLLYGILGGTDQDMMKFTVPPRATQLSLELAPLGDPSGVGVNGYGSGIGRISVRVLQPDTTVIGAWTSTAATYDTTTDSIGVPVTGGSEVLVSIERPTGSTPTANDFYFALLSFLPDNPREIDGVAAPDAGTGLDGGIEIINDTFATPQILPLTVDSTDNKLKKGYILGRIVSPTDVDHYSLEVKSADQVSLACGALRTGSGLTATFALLSSAGAPLQSETETVAADVFWGTRGNGMPGSRGPVTIAGPDGGTDTVVFKVTGIQSSTNTGDWYRCGFYVTSP